MWPAQETALQALPPDRAVNPFPTTSFVLHCHAPRCASCAQYEGESKASFEAERFRGAHVVPWDCGDERRRAFALAAGVDALPAYIVVGDTLTVVQPPV
jgi:hypothetical protein